MLVLHLNQRDDQQLILSDSIIGARSGIAHRLSDDHQQLDRHSGLVTERLKGGFTKGTPAVVGGTVDEGKRDHPAPHCLSEACQRESGTFQRLDDSNPANVALGVQARPVRLEDARLDHAGNVGGFDARPRCDLVSRDSLHPGSVDQLSTGGDGPTRHAGSYTPTNNAVLQRLVEPEQYTSVRFGESLLLAGMIPSIGPVGDVYDNALAETIIGLYKTECTPPRFPTTASSA